VLFNELTRLVREENARRGYEEVKTPILTDVSLWRQSGHWDKFRDNMYFTEVEGRQMGLKPMNCPAHIQIYKADRHSYRDLPVRYSEAGLVHRHEASGVLHGLLRVRAFTQDDAHIFCSEEQIEDEVLGCLDLGFDPDDTAALAAQGVAAAQHGRQPDRTNRSVRFGVRTTRLAAGGLDADFSKPLDEKAPILGIADRCDGRAENLDAVFRKYSCIMQRKAAVKCSLAAKRKQDGVNAFLDDDLFDEFRSHGYQVDAVGKLPARLDGRDVRVYQHRGDPFLPQRHNGL